MEAEERVRAERRESMVEMIGGHRVEAETSGEAENDVWSGEQSVVEPETLGGGDNLQRKQVMGEEVRVSGDLEKKKVVGPTPEINPEKTREVNRTKEVTGVLDQTGRERPEVKGGLSDKKEEEDGSQGKGEAGDRDSGKRSRDGEEAGEEEMMGVRKKMVEMDTWQEILPQGGGGNDLQW